MKGFIESLIGLKRIFFVDLLGKIQSQTGLITNVFTIFAKKTAL